MRAWPSLTLRCRRPSRHQHAIVFLEQAKAAQARQPLRVADGWIYFIHGWTSVIAEVFDIDIPAAGPSFELLSRIALDAAQERYPNFRVGNVERGRLR